MRNKCAGCGTIFRVFNISCVHQVSFCPSVSGDDCQSAYIWGSCWLEVTERKKRAAEKSIILQFWQFTVCHGLAYNLELQQCSGPLVLPHTNLCCSVPVWEPNGTETLAQLHSRHTIFLLWGRLNECWGGDLGILWSKAKFVLLSLYSSSSSKPSFVLVGTQFGPEDHLYSRCPSIRKQTIIQ